jgi:hypothetical protein
MKDQICRPVEVSRRIEASAGDIFQILTDPTMHLALDGSGMLRSAETSSIVTRKGDVFVMNMYFPALGDYQMDNYVVEFEVDRRISWEPVAGKGHPEVGGRLGHRWGYLLTPDGPDATVVTEIYDCSSAPPAFRQDMDDGESWRADMARTLKRLDEIACGS